MQTLRADAEEECKGREREGEGARESAEILAAKKGETKEGERSVERTGRRRRQQLLLNFEARRGKAKRDAPRCDFMNEHFRVRHTQR